MEGRRLEVKETGIVDSYKMAGEAPLLLDVSNVGRDGHIVWKLLKVAEREQREGISHHFACSRHSQQMEACTPYSQHCPCLAPHRCRASQDVRAQVKP